MKQAFELFSDKADQRYLATFRVMLPEGSSSWDRSGANNFFQAYPNSYDARIFISEAGAYGLSFDVNAGITQLSVSGPTEEFVNSILYVFDSSKPPQRSVSRHP